MAEIRFSHAYYKLHGQTKAYLAGELPIHLVNDGSMQELLDFDTTYPGGRLKLEDGDYHALMFMGDKGIPFTSIRKHYPAQEGDYYEGKIGEIFDIKLKSGAEKELEEDLSNVIQKVDVVDTRTGKTVETGCYYFEMPSWEPYPSYQGQVNSQVVKKAKCIVKKKKAEWGLMCEPVVYRVEEPFKIVLSKGGAADGK